MKKTAILLFMLILTVVFLTGCQESIETKYMNAQALIAEGKYAEAAAKFESLGSYEESSMLAMYCKAAAAGECGDYDTAFSGFRGLGEYKDSRMMLDYYSARSYEDGNWRNKLRAATMFEQNSLFRDSARRAENCRQAVYEEAQRLRDNGDFDGACVIMEALGSYQGASSQIPEIRYQQAKDLMEKGDYAGAFSVFSGLSGYKDVDILLANDHNLVAVAAAAVRDKKYSVGNYVTFGHYPQTSGGNDSTPIEWLVLARDGNKALLLSRYGLDVQPYNNEKTSSITWEKCTLRTWLNGTFLNKAFTTQEQAGIVITSVDNSSSQGSPRRDVSGGNNTQDRVFLLSYAEAHKYFDVQPYIDSYEVSNTNKKSRAAPTAYAISQGARTTDYLAYKMADGKFPGDWWLRSTASSTGYAECISLLGCEVGSDICSDEVLVRPALWINLESDIF